MTEILPQSGNSKEKKHRYPVRIYYEDTDIGGVVYYANYLKFMERARSEMLRSLDIHQIEMLSFEKTGDVAFVVRHCELDFIKPATLDDQLTVETDILKIGGASIVLRQQIFNHNDVLVKAVIKIGAIDQKGSPQRLPKQIVEKLN